MADDPATTGEVESTLRLDRRQLKILDIDLNLER